MTQTLTPSVPAEKPASHCDLLIIGAGPAGMAAALAAAPSGLAIIVIDDNLAPGGQIWRDGPAAHLPPAARQQREAVAKASNVRVLTSTRLVARTGAKEWLLENAEHGWRLSYERMILCTGARELLLPFPGWTLPGVTGAGGLQALIKGGLDVRGERIVVAGSGPLLLAVAATAQAAGAQVLRIAEQAPWGAVAQFSAALVRWPSKIWQALPLAHAGYRASSHVLAATGQGSVQSVRVQQGRAAIDIACDRLACGFGLIPNTTIGQALGCTLTPQHGVAVDEWQATSLADHFAAGECTGFGGSERAWVQGSIAGYAASDQRPAAQALRPERQHWNAFADALNRHFALRPALKKLAAPDTLLCRCEDVAYADVQPFDHWSAAKLATRCGMGACQGRICGGAAQFLFDWPPAAPRAPFTPARIATLALQSTPVAPAAPD